MKKLLLLILLIPMFGATQTQPSATEPQWEKNDDHNFIALGTVTQEQILTLPVFQYRYNAYEPAADLLEQIRNSPPAEIKVVFGDWCSDSKKHVPAFMKIIKMAGNPVLQITYINVDRQKKEPSDVIAPLKIESVPTFIITMNGKEAGRIVESPKESMEQDLADLLSGFSTN